MYAVALKHNNTKMNEAIKRIQNGMRDICNDNVTTLNEMFISSEILFSNEFFFISGT